MTLINNQLQQAAKTRFNHEEKTVRVFVYGSLRQGFGNNRCLGDSTLEGEGFVSGYTMLDLGAFPAVVPSKGESLNPIYGELYGCDANTMRRLDQLEGAPRFYHRKIVTVDTREGQVEAIMYVLTDDDRRAKVIESGNWDDSLHNVEAIEDYEEWKTKLPKRWQSI